MMTKCLKHEMIFRGLMIETGIKRYYYRMD